MLGRHILAAAIGGLIATSSGATEFTYFDSLRVRDLIEAKLRPYESKTNYRVEYVRVKPTIPEVSFLASDDFNPELLMSQDLAGLACEVLSGSFDTILISMTVHIWQKPETTTEFLWGC